MKGENNMAINVHHTYSTHVSIIFYSTEGIALHCDDCGTMDDISEQASEILIKHNFDYADVCSAETGELLMIIERT
jgi:hypothetical protein